MAAASPCAGRLHARPGLRGCELSPLLPRDARRTASAAPAAATLIAMDAPPPMENCRPFVHVAALLRAAGVHAPQVLGAGPRPRLPPARGPRHDHVPRGAAATATRTRSTSTRSTRWCASSARSREGVLPPYDEALLRRELDLFPDWYVARHLARTLDAAQRDALEGVFARVLANNLAQPRVFVHRDYHSRNLMVRPTPNPGVLDFQDAVYGPGHLRSRVAPARRLHRVGGGAADRLGRPLLGEGARRGHRRSTPTSASFWRDFEWMGVQRQLKVLGIFARLCSSRRQVRAS